MEPYFSNTGVRFRAHFLFFDIYFLRAYSLARERPAICLFDIALGRRFCLKCRIECHGFLILLRMRITYLGQDEAIGNGKCILYHIARAMHLELLTAF